MTVRTVTLLSCPLTLSLSLYVTSSFSSSLSLSLSLSLFIKYTKFKLWLFTIQTGSPSSSLESDPETGFVHCGLFPMAEEKDAFFVVRKGDVVGIYKSFTDIQPLLSSSVSGESISIYKGYSLPKKAEEYLVSNGLKEASYSISAANVHEGLFGRLVACPYQHPYSSGGRAFDVNSSSKSFQGPFQSDTGVAGSSFFSTNSQRHHTPEGSQAELSTCLSCILEFDGASKGNPGPAGAGAVLRAEDGSKVYRLREGVGTQTNNVAEYRALILGLKHAIKKGYKHIRVQGDSLLVCNQIQGLWKIKNQNMAYLCNEAKELKDKFLSFRINHVLREYNSEADVQANLAINLKAGQVEEDCQLL